MMDCKNIRSILVSLGFVTCGLASPMVQANKIEPITPAALEARIAESKEALVVNITSTDPNCGYCIQANKKFVQLASSTSSDTVHFAQVSWAPWANIPEELRPLFQRNQIAGIPVKMAFKDGQLIDKVVGVPPDAPAATPPATPSPLHVTGNIPVVDSNKIAEKIRQSKGILVVQLTSFETTCSFCIRSNPIFEEFTKAPENSNIQFLRVAYRPWVQMGTDAFAQTLGYTGLPIFVTYKDGKLVRKHGGMAEKPELQKALLIGVQ
jgi:thiol-disulfide isomerase/thioredoxin